MEVSSRFQADPRERAATLERVGSVDYAMSSPWREAGDAWVSVGETDKAVQDYFEAWYRETDDWRATAMLSKLYRDQGEARKSEKTAGAISPVYNAIMQKWAWEQFGPPDYELDVGGADIGWVKGFHAAETQEVEGQSVTYRWSTGSASMKVRRRADDRTVTLLARALPGSNGEPITVRFFINGIDVGEREMDGQWKRYEFKLSDAMLRDDTVMLEIRAPARRPSAEDRRELAVAVDSVSTGP
jgi:hypothetical protein